MSVQMDIRESETGMIRVFHLNLPPEAIERYTVQAGTGEWPLMYGLGAKKLSASFIDIVDIRDLEGMALSQYLVEAHNVPEAEVAQHAARLNKLRDHVLILPSQAFAKTAQTITARVPLQWIATFEEVKARGSGAPVRSKSAAKSGSKADGVSAETDIKMKILIGMAILIAVVAAVVLL